MRLRTSLVALCIVSITATSQAWGPAGHKIVASIAFRRLAPEKQAKIVALLKKHPRYEDDFAGKMPDDLSEQLTNEWIVQQAAVWPDLARGLNGPGLRKKYHHGTWHYINLPHYLSDADEAALKDQVKNKVNISFDVPTDADGIANMNVVQAIAHSRSILFDQNANPSDRALQLSWLIHMVGDLHQPLHSTALFSRKLFPDGDQGGNKIQTERRKNLHSLWDGFPGSPNFTTTRNRAARLLQDEQMKELGEQALTADDVKIWLEESHMLAKTEAYDGEVMNFFRQQEQDSADAELARIPLSDEYLKQGGAVATRRLVQAGYRLAKLLDGLQ